MISTGIVRNVDELGRIVLPIELRKTMNIAIKDSLEIYVSEGTIVLKKFTSGCLFCGEMRSLKKFKGYDICSICLSELP